MKHKTHTAQVNAQYKYLLIILLFLENTSMLTDNSTGCCPYCYSMDLNYQVTLYDSAHANINHFYKKVLYSNSRKTCQCGTKLCPSWNCKCIQDEEDFEHADEAAIARQNCTVCPCVCEECKK